MPPINWKPSWCTCSLLYGEPHLIKTYSTWRRHVERQARLDAGASVHTTHHDVETADDYDTIMAEEYVMPEHPTLISVPAIPSNVPDITVQGSNVLPSEQELSEETSSQLERQQPTVEDDNEGLEELYLGSNKEGRLDEEMLEWELQRGQIDEIEEALRNSSDIESEQAFIYDSTSGQYCAHKYAVV
jgi:hypothetical protein